MRFKWLKWQVTLLFYYNFHKDHGCVEEYRKKGEVSWRSLFLNIKNPIKRSAWGASWQTVVKTRSCRGHRFKSWGETKIPQLPIRKKPAWSLSIAQSFHFLHLKGKNWASEIHWSGESTGQFWWNIALSQWVSHLWEESQCAPAMAFCSIFC